MKACIKHTITLTTHGQGMKQWNTKPHRVERNHICFAHLLQRAWSNMSALSSITLWPWNTDCVIPAYTLLKLRSAPVSVSVWIPHIQEWAGTQISPPERPQAVCFSVATNWDMTHKIGCCYTVILWPICTSKTKRKWCRVNLNASLCSQRQKRVDVGVSCIWVSVSWLCIILQTSWQRITNSWHLESLRMQPEATLAKKHRLITAILLFKHSCV